MDFFSKTGMGFYPSPFAFSPEMPINTGNLRMNGKSLPFITLHHPSSFLPVFALLRLMLTCYSFDSKYSEL